MALDTEVKDLITTEIMVGSRESARLTGLADRNVTQGLAVIQNTVVQSVAGSADDAQLIAALRTADRVPNATTNG
ncbi:hypothetical protein [Porticoccus sp.]